MRLSHPFEVITPTVDGDILAVLGRADGPFSGRQIHKLVGQHSEAGIRKALDRLVGQGIVVRDRVGNTHLHSLNQEHLAADAIRSLARLRERTFDLMADTLRSWPHPPTLALVFGSAARQEESAGSDIDVLLIPPAEAEQATWQHAVSSFAEATSKATGNDVRILELTAAELWAPGNDALRQELQRDAVVLLGSRSVLNRRLQ